MAGKKTDNQSSLVIMQTDRSATQYQNSLDGSLSEKDQDFCQNYQQKKAASILVPSTESVIDKFNMRNTVGNASATDAR